MRAIGIIPILWVAIAMAGCSGVPARVSVLLPDLPPVASGLPDPQVAFPLPPEWSPPSQGGPWRDAHMTPMFGMCCGGVVFLDSLWRPVDGLIDLFGGTANYAAALAAEDVELVVLKARKTAAGEVSGYDELGGFTLAEEEAAVLRATLTDDAAYDWREEHFDEDAPVYSFRVKLRSQDRVVAVDLAMARGEARVVIDGREVARQSFTFGYETVASLLERHFPQCVEKRR